MSNEEIIARLLEFDPLLNISKFWVSAARDISFNLLFGIKGFVDALGEGVSQMYQLMNFGTAKQLEILLIRIVR